MKTAKTSSSPESTHTSIPIRNSDQKNNFFPAKSDSSLPFFGPSTIQPKLKIGQPGDKYEQEADRVADAVVNSPGPHVQRQPIEEEEEMLQMQPVEEEEEMLQTQPIEEEEELQMKREPALQRKCKECEQEEKLQKKAVDQNFTHVPAGTVHRKPAKDLKHPIQLKSAGRDRTQLLEKGLGEDEPLITIGQEMLAKSGNAVSFSNRSQKEGWVQAKSDTSRELISESFNTKLRRSLASGGRSMSKSVQREMEQSFGHDFNGVMIHDNENAMDMTREINAKAFTFNNHIFFNSGQYSPGKKNGKKLLAHELTHTIQQGAAEKKTTIQRTIGDGHDFPAASNFSRNRELEATFDNERTVQNGHRGAHVTLIQTALTNLGYDLPIHGTDGIFGSETERAVRAFQQDVGLGVDGVVGFSTIDFLDKRDRGAEVAPPARPVGANTPFNVNNAIVQPGAAPSNALGACQWGLTFPENVQVTIDVFQNGAVWQPVLSEVVGNYSLQHRLLPAQNEVTGPGGNTNAGNYCAQITELDALGNCPGAWYMDAAVLEHERVHATRFRPALIHGTVINPLETAIEALSIPIAAAPNAAGAEARIRANAAFATALTNAQANWLARILVLVAGDHAAGGPAETAEHRIVDPMVRRICRHARRNGWPACPPLCP